MKWIKQGVTAYPIMLQMVSSTDHVTGLTGATVVITISKNGAALAAATGAVVELTSGWYKYTPSAADTNTIGTLAIHAIATGADPNDKEVEIVAVDVTDTVRFGLTALPNAVAEASGGLVTRGTGTGQIALTAGAVTAGTVSDKTGYSLSVTPPTAAATATAVRSELTTELGRIDAAVTTRLATAGYTAPDSAAAITTAVWASGTRSLTTFGTLAADTTTAVWAAGSRTLTGFGTLVADITTAVWASGSRTLTGFGTLVADTATAVWGAVSRTLSTFAFTVDTNPNATETAIAAYLDTEIAAIKTNTDKLTDVTASQLEIALKQFTNRVTVVSNVLTVYDDDETTVLETFTLTPISGNAGYSERTP